MTSTSDFTGTRTIDAAPEAIVEGSTFAERYAIEGRLGTGAQATVYSALDMLASPPRRVALKVARAKETNLSREADLLTRTHGDGDVAGVVRLVEPGSCAFGGVQYLVLEYIDGPTLRNAVMSSADIFRLGGRIANTLASIHKANVVFADVKPENILLREGTEPVLVDFGAAREIHDSHSPLLLTPAYASPEQHAGQAPTPASDVYALALVLDELAEARAPRKLIKILERAKAENPMERLSAIDFSRALESASVSQSRNKIHPYILGISGIALILTITVTVMMVLNLEGPTTSHIQQPKQTLTPISAPGKVQYLAMGDTHIHWTDGDGRTVYRAPLRGGAAEIVTQLENPAHQLVVSGQTLFIRSPGVIWSFSHNQLNRFAESTGRGGIVADARYVVWTNEDSGEVVIASVRADAPFRVLASAQARPYSLTMDATHVYWANEGDGTISRVSREKGSVEVLVRGQSWPASIVVDETHLYWLDRAAGSMMRLAKSGGEPQFVTKISYGSWSMTLDKTHLYWTSTEDGRVLRISKMGGVPQILAMGQPRPFDILVWENQAYFSNCAGGGGVMQVGLP